MKKMKSDFLDVVGIRLVKERSLESAKELNSPEAVVNLFLKEMESYDREVFAVFNVSTKGKVLNVNIASMGTINATLVTGREVFKSSILSNAKGIILAHNHPSGDVTPSREDLEVTKMICEGGRVLGIEVLDHVIVGGNNENYYSMSKEGDLSGRCFPRTNLFERVFGKKEGLDVEEEFER